MVPAPLLNPIVSAARSSGPVQRNVNRTVRYRRLRSRTRNGLPAAAANAADAGKRQVIRQDQRVLAASSLQQVAARLARQWRQRVENRRPIRMLNLQRVMDQVADIDRHLLAGSEGHTDGPRRMPR